MLLEIARLLSDDVRALGVFEYITLRAVLACATALLIGLVAGPRVIRKLTEMKIGQAVRSYGPETHLVKTGTPTMGGVLIRFPSPSARCCGPTGPTVSCGWCCW